MLVGTVLEDQSQCVLVDDLLEILEYHFHCGLVVDVVVEIVHRFENVATTITVADSWEHFLFVVQYFGGWKSWAYCCGRGCCCT